MPAAQRSLAFSCAVACCVVFGVLVAASFHTIAGTVGPGTVGAGTASAGTLTPPLDRLVIGVVVSPVGPAADLSTALQGAIEAEVQALSPKPVLLVETDRCSAAGADDVARRLVARGVTIVIGHPCSNAAMSAAKIYAAAQIPFVAVGARHPDLTDKRAGPLVFRLGGRDDRQTADTVAALGDRLNGKTIAVIHDRTRAQRRLADAMAAALRPIAERVQLTAIVAGEKGYDGLVSGLNGQKPDAIYFALFPPEAKMVAQGLMAANSKSLFIFSEASLQTERDIEVFAGPGRQSARTVWMQSTFNDHAALSRRTAMAVKLLHAAGTKLTADGIVAALGAEAAAVAGPGFRPGDVSTPSYRAVQR